VRLKPLIHLSSKSRIIANSRVCASPFVEEGFGTGGHA
jgi:hypothetical protein